MNSNLKVILLSFLVFCLVTTSFAIGKISIDDILCNIDSKVIYVDDDNKMGPWNGTLKFPYQYIHDAVENATNGDTIFVFNGTYLENLIVDKTLSIIGEKENSTIIDGKYKGYILHILSDSVILKNFTIRNSGGFRGNAGIILDEDNCFITQCIFHSTKTGLYIRQSNLNEIDNCTFHHSGEGLLLEFSNNTVIAGCTFAHNSIGIRLENSTNTQIRFTYLHTNGIAGYFNNSHNIDIIHCNISDNSPNLGGLYFLSCTNIHVVNCNIRHNGAGLSIFSSEALSITDSDFCLNTHFAVALRTESQNISITRCNIHDNFRYGIYVEEYNRFSIVNCNIFSNMLYGIYIKRADCDARYNWWGSVFGPSLSELRSSSKISWIPGRTHYFPWCFLQIQNIGANWDHNKPYMEHEIVSPMEREINLSGFDTDGDSVPDWWEEKWGYDPYSWDDHENLDPDNDALNNIEECYTDQYDSDPFHKDVFLELDWMKSSNPLQSNKPPKYLINRLVRIFHEHNISLHVDTGDLEGGEEIPLCSAYSFEKIRDIYWDYFLHNVLNNPRKGIFHYGVICNNCPDLNFPFFGWDHLDSFAISAKGLKQIFPLYTKGRLIVGGAVHHLGHSFGLVADIYGGIDNLGTRTLFSNQWFRYRNYKSCMNYYYKYKLFCYSDGTNGRGDFDDWGHLDLSFFKNSHFEWPKQ
jgi:parallel beta-helix repeat protein